jgi:sporulation protein YlmC with PRC-barrel domain
MEVYDHDGVHLGRVKEVREVDFWVDRRWRSDIRVPIERVLAVMDRSVYLTAA